MDLRSKERWLVGKLLTLREFRHIKNVQFKYPRLWLPDDHLHWATLVVEDFIKCHGISCLVCGTVSGLREELQDTEYLFRLRERKKPRRTRLRLSICFSEMRGIYEIAEITRHSLGVSSFCSTCLRRFEMYCMTRKKRATKLTEDELEVMFIAFAANALSRTNGYLIGRNV